MALPVLVVVLVVLAVVVLALYRLWLVVRVLVLYPLEAVAMVVLRHLVVVYPVVVEVDYPLPVCPATLSQLSRAQGQSYPCLAHYPVPHQRHWWGTLTICCAYPGASRTRACEAN